MRTLLAVRAGAAARIEDAALILPEAGQPVPEAGETAAKSRHGKLLSREEAAPAGMAGGRTSLRE
jgi:hypothetical protein